MRVGIIGYGRMGKLLTSYLAQDSTLVVFDKIDCSQEIVAQGARAVTLEEVCRQQVILLAVPISDFEGVVKEIKDLITAGSLVIDLCSVKQHPVEIMQKYLPESVAILGTHPMFGPDSASTTLYGTKIVLSRVRLDDDRYNNIKKYLERHGIKVIEATAEQHDREIGHSLLLTHVIGRTLIEMQVQPLAIDTLGYRRLMKILGTVENDSWQLFSDMNKYNAFAPGIREEFRDALNSVLERLEK